MSKAGSFTAEFHSRLESIIKRGEAVGVTLTGLCKKANVARATPDRWRKKAPLSISLVDRFEDEVLKAEADAASAKEAAPDQQ
jgi:hypothetical protein